MSEEIHIHEAIAVVLDTDELVRYKRLEGDVEDAKLGKSHGAVASLRKQQEEIFIAAKTRTSEGATTPEQAISRLKEMADQLGYELVPIPPREVKAQEKGSV